MAHEHHSGVHAGQDIGELIHRRYHFLQHQHESHGGPDADIPFLHLDEHVLQTLAANGTSDRDGYFDTAEYLAIEAWAVEAFTKRTGVFTDPQDRAASPLPGSVLQRATTTYACPPGCSTTAEPGCDGCTACEGGAHRRRGLAAFELYRLLDQARWDAYLETRD